jgi:hypothetical protein
VTAASDLAITLGCGEQCPYASAVKYVDWPVDDPRGQDDATVHRIIGDLEPASANSLPNSSRTPTSHHRS